MSSYETRNYGNTSWEGPPSPLAPLGAIPIGSIRFIWWLGAGYKEQWNTWSKNNRSFYKTRKTEQEVNAFINIQIKCCKWKRKQVGLPVVLPSLEMAPHTFSSSWPNPHWKRLWRSTHPPTSFSWARTLAQALADHPRREHPSCPGGKHPSGSRKASLPQLQAKSLLQSLAMSSPALTSLPAMSSPAMTCLPPLVTGNWFLNCKLMIQRPKGWSEKWSTASTYNNCQTQVDKLILAHILFYRYWTQHNLN